MNYKDTSYSPPVRTSVNRITIGDPDTKTRLGPNGFLSILPNSISRNSFGDITFYENDVEDPETPFIDKYAPTTWSTNPEAVDAATKRSLIMYSNVSTDLADSGPSAIVNPYLNASDPEPAFALWGLSSVFRDLSGDVYFFAAANTLSGSGIGRIQRFDLDFGGIPRYTETIRLLNEHVNDVAIIPAFGVRPELVAWTNIFGELWIGPSRTQSENIKIDAFGAIFEDRALGITYLPFTDSLYVVTYPDAAGDNLAGRVWNIPVDKALLGISTSIFIGNLQYVPHAIAAVQYVDAIGDLQTFLDITYESSSVESISEGHIARYRDTGQLFHDFNDGATSGFSEAGFRGPLAVAGTPLYAGETLACSSPCEPLGVPIPELPPNLIGLFGLLLSGFVLGLRKFFFPA
jgi:hypothetical protein